MYISFSFIVGHIYMPTYSKYKLLLPEKVECYKHGSSQYSPHYDSSQSWHS